MSLLVCISPCVYSHSPSANMPVLSGTLIRVLAPDTVVFQCDNKVVLQCVLLAPLKDPQYQSALQCCVFNTIKCRMNLGTYDATAHVHKDCVLLGCVFKPAVARARMPYKARTRV